MILTIIMVIGCIVWWIRSGWNLATTSDDDWGSFLLSGLCLIITLLDAGGKIF